MGNEARHAIGKGANGTGDINFAAACMAVGIPLNQECPARAVKCESGRDYCRFFLETLSVDGLVKLEWCNTAWRKRTAPDDGPMAGFGWVMDFISARPAGVRTSGDWLTWAHDHLRGLGIAGSWTWPRKLDEVGDFVSKHGHDRAGHVFAYVLNRSVCLETADQAAEDPRLLLNKGREFTMVRDRASASRKRQFFEDIG